MQQYQPASYTLTFRQRATDLSGELLCCPGAPAACATLSSSLSEETVTPQLHRPDELLATYSEDSWEEREPNISYCTAQPSYFDEWNSNEHGLYLDLAGYLGMAPDGGDVGASYPYPVSNEDMGNTSVFALCPDQLQKDYPQAGTRVTPVTAKCASESESESEGDSEAETEIEAQATVGNYTKRRQKASRRRGPCPGIERQCTVFALAKTEKPVIRRETTSRPAPHVHVCQHPLSPDTDGRTCQVPFARPEHLRRHVQTVHGNNKQFLCRVANCTGAFTRRDNLRDHYWTRVERNGRSGTNKKMSLEALGAVLGRKEKRLMRRLKKRLQRWQTKTESSLSTTKRIQLSNWSHRTLAVYPTHQDGAASTSSQPTLPERTKRDYQSRQTDVNASQR